MSSVRLPTDLAGRVAARAAAERRSVAQMTALLVEQGLRSLGEAGDGLTATADPAAVRERRPVSPSDPVAGYARPALAERDGESAGLRAGGDLGREASQPSRSASAGKGTRTAARRSDMCPHRVRAGAYCKRCEKTI